LDSPQRSLETIMTSAIILHHFEESPFSEKIRVIFGLKNLDWTSVLISRIMPQPDLMPLTVVIAVRR
jgi:glutathione S-transferase-like protein